MSNVTQIKKLRILLQRVCYTIHAHYLRPHIQNEIISLMATNVKNCIVNDKKRAKYFSVLLDCTPYMSHQEQMSLILRFVNMTSLEVNVQKHFIVFIAVSDQTAKGLSNALLAELEALGLLRPSKQ